MHWISSPSAAICTFVHGGGGGNMFYSHKVTLGVFLATNDWLYTGFLPSVVYKSAKSLSSLVVCGNSTQKSITTTHSLIFGSSLLTMLFSCLFEDWVLSCVSIANHTPFTET